MKLDSQIGKHQITGRITDRRITEGKVEEDDQAVKLHLFKRCERNRCEQEKVASFLKTKKRGMKSFFSQNGKF